MLFKSALVTSVSGSVGGMTGSHNAGGMYFRARAVPTNPSSAAQQSVRGIMSTVTSLWSGSLSAAQRDAWATYAANVKLPNALGDPRNVSPIAMFVRSNVPRRLASLGYVLDAPTVFDLGSFTEIALIANESGNKLSIGFTDTDDWVSEDDAAMLVLGSREFAPTINYFKGPYRFAGSVDGDATTPPTSPTLLTNNFAQTTGNQVAVQVRVTRADGRLSGPQFIKTTIVA